MRRAFTSHKVTLVELQDDIAADCLKYPFLWLHHEIEERDIRVMTSSSCSKIDKDTVTVRRADGTHCISVSVQFDVFRSTQCAENRLADVYQGTQSASRYLGSLLLQPLNKI